MKASSTVLNGGGEETYPQGNAPCPYPPRRRYAGAWRPSRGRERRPPPRPPRWKPRRSKPRRRTAVETLKRRKR